VTDGQPEDRAQKMPTWLWRAIALFWLGFICTLVLRWGFDRLHTIVVLLVVSLFLSFAIEPGVNRLARRGWRRGSATGLILFGVFVVALGFVVSIGTLMYRQVADLLQNSEEYVNRIVDFLNDNFGTNIDAAEVNDRIADPEGPVQEFIRDHSDEAIRLSAAALAFLLQMFSVMLITFYLVADGPRLRRALCSRLRPDLQKRVLGAWDLAITKTGGYLYSRVLLAGLSAFFHWVAFQILEVPAPVALALWVGVISQFIPVVGTYIAGVLPILVTLINFDSPVRALIVLGVIVVYQQIENYVFAPRITARTLELHPAIAFIAALAGAATLGAVGAILALPAVAMVSAFLSEWGKRHDVQDHPLTEVLDRSEVRRRRRDRHPVVQASEPEASTDVAPP
jgi:predicted PurR-regulated permease PerM